MYVRILSKHIILLRSNFRAALSCGYNFSYRYTPIQTFMKVLLNTVFSCTWRNSLLHKNDENMVANYSTVSAPLRYVHMKRHGTWSQHQTVPCPLFPEVVTDHIWTESNIWVYRHLNLGHCLGRQLYLDVSQKILDEFFKWGWA